MATLSETLKRWKWYIVAYVAFFSIFWFVGNAKVTLSAVEAYLALLLLHALFGFFVWAIRSISKRS